MAGRSICLILATAVLTGPAAGAAPPDRLTPEQTAQQIDALFAESWKRNAVEPAPRADDAEFLRRVSLDLAGRIPSVSEVRDFLADSRPDKRRQTVERLLDSPASVRNLTTILRNALIPQAVSQPQLRGLVPGFEAWLWEHVARSTPWDEIVREILTSPVGVPNAQVPGALSAPSSPEAFYVVRELKPENLATGTARAFLGVRLDCAQCHDHPFDKWSQQQFWNLAAFFAGFSNPDADADDSVPMALTAENPEARSIRIPGTDEQVSAVFLTGTTPDWTRNSAPRDVLAQWVTSPDNPWFARMAVNRMWARFFGLGLVHPVDDFSENNPPSHPEVLELLAEQFVAHNYDLKFLIRTLTATRVYQATSRMTDASQEDPTQFARAPLRGLTPEQFFDSLAEAVGYYQPYRSDNPFVVDAETPRGRFLDLFRDESDSPLQKETTILQALAMMNSEFVGTATSLENSRTLRAITEFPLMSDEERLETLFLASLGRFPTDAERQTFGRYVAEGGPSDSTPDALADVFWVLLNSSEFLLNH